MTSANIFRVEATTVGIDKAANDREVTITGMVGFHWSIEPHHDRPDDNMSR
jgi:hypothetical protein